MHTIRVTGVLIENDRILLVKQRLIDEDREWSLPGGKVEPGESLADALVRELKEETGLDVAVASLLYVAEKVDRALLHLSFLLKRIGGQLQIPSNQHEANPITDIAFVPVDELPNYGFTPRWKNLVENDFNSAPGYVGDKSSIGL